MDCEKQDLLNFLKFWEFQSDFKISGNQDIFFRETRVLGGWFPEENRYLERLMKIGWMDIWKTGFIEFSEILIVSVAILSGFEIPRHQDIFFPCN